MIRGNVRRTVALLLTCAMIVSLLPLFGSSVYADDEETVDEIEELSKEEFEEEKKKAEAELDKKMGVIDEEPAEVPEENGKAVAEATEKLVDPKDVKSGLKDDSGDLKLQAEPPADYGIYVGDPDANGMVEVQAYVGDTGYSFDSIYMDDEEVTFGSDSVYGMTSFTAHINMKNYDVGYHTIYVRMNYEGSDSGYQLYKEYVPTYIYEKPANSISWYYTYVNSVALYYDGSSYSNDTDCDVYMFYKNGKKAWTTASYGPVSDSSYSKSKKSGFKPNTTVQVRLTYGKKFTYKDQTFLFTGRLTNQSSGTVKVKTAYKKPKVKSIKITKGKLKVQRWKVLYAYRYRYRVNRRTGYRRLISVTPLYHRYKKYYTKFKVTVRFKKKQGIAGVYIGTIHKLYAYKKGNKKKYSQTFTCTGKKKGKKVKVSVKCWRSNTYGGYSKSYKKKVKVR